MEVKFFGKMSTFGGPNDMGVAPDEGLALVDSDNFHQFTEVFLPQQPNGTTGLARRLDPGKFYLACRWNYNVTPRDDLAKAVVTVRNPQTGQEVNARPVDWGPAAWTDRVADLSPGLASSLNLSTDDIVEITVSLDQPAPDNSQSIVKIIENTFFKESTAQSLLLNNSQKVSVSKGTSLEYQASSLKRFGEHYQLELINSIAPWGSTGFLYREHVDFQHKDIHSNFTEKLVKLLLSDQYDSILQEAIDLRGNEDNTCVAFASTALRKLGVQVPKYELGDDECCISLVTLPFKKWLEGNISCSRIDNPESLLHGDVCFSKDEPGYPGYPAHVYFFIRYYPGDKGAAYIVDNQRPYGEHVRNLDAGRPFNTPFSYALRLNI